MGKTLNASTTAQSLSALLKSARDIMRKDKGLNGDLDRLPMLTCRSSRREEAHPERSEVRSRKLIRASLPRLLRIQDTLTNAHDFLKRSEHVPQSRPNDNLRRPILRTTAAKIHPMKKPSKQSLTQKAVHAMTDAVAKVVEEHQRQGPPLAVWRDGKAVWISATETAALRETPIPYRTKSHG